MLPKKGESKNVPKKGTFNEIVKTIPKKKKMTVQEINQRVNQILSGGKIRNRKII